MEPWQRCGYNHPAAIPCSTGRPAPRCAAGASIRLPWTANRSRNGARYRFNLHYRVADFSQANMNQTLGFSHYWSQGDAITHTVAYLLLLMSVLSWYYILSKTWSAWRIRRSAGALDGFWKAPSLNDATAMLRKVDGERVYLPL